MKKYVYYLYNNKNRNVLLVKYKLFKRNKIFFNLITRYSIVSNSKIKLQKKLVLYCFDSIKRSLFFLRGVCYISGKFNSSMHSFVFKKNTLKYLLNFNLIPNINKKYK